MTARGFRRRPLDLGDVADDAERAARDEWSVLVRPRGSKKAYARQILIDVAIAVVALAVIAFLSW